MSLGTKIEEHDNVAEVGSTQSSQPQSIEEAGSKEAFLASFAPQDDKNVMRKVDRRFLLLIGILYMTKNVSATPSRFCSFVGYTCLCYVRSITSMHP